jgi:exonuclease III
MSDPAEKSAYQPPNRLRVMFWNVRDLGQKREEHDDDVKRVKEIANQIKSNQVDVASIAELVQPDMMYELQKMLPGYVIQINSNNGGHTLATIFKQAASRSIVVRQADRFRGPQGKGRAYTSVDILDHDTDTRVSLLSMHQKAGSSPRDMSIRERTLKDVAKMADNLRHHNVPLIIMGDMNTVGNSGRVDEAAEVKRMDSLLYDPFDAANGMAYEDWSAGRMLRLTKDEPATWHGVGRDQKYGDCDLDHVYVSEELYSSIRDMDEHGNKVRVRGWTQLDTVEKQDDWVRDVSDHAPIYFDINFN